MITKVREATREPVGVLVRPQYERTPAGEAAFKLHVDSLVRLGAGLPILILPPYPNGDVSELVAGIERVATWHPETIGCLPLTLGGIEAAHLLARTGVSFGVYPVATPASAAALRDAMIDAHHGRVVFVVPVGALYRAGYNGFAYLAAVRAATAGMHIPVTVLALVEQVHEYTHAREIGVSTVADPDVILADRAAVDASALREGLEPEPVPGAVNGSQSYAISSPLVDALLSSLDASL